MKEMIKDVFLMGIGAASLTKKKAEKTIIRLVKKGAIDRKQAKEILDKIMSEAKKAKERLKKEGKKEIKIAKKKIISKGRKVKNKIKKSIARTARNIARRI